MKRYHLIYSFILAGSLSACVTNPVTGERDFILQSQESDVQTGAQAYAPLTQVQGGEFKLDPQMTAYVKSVGQKLAAVSDNPLPYEFVVLNNPVPNAWALPGGKMAINTGLLWELNSEAELAAVLGHEVVHAAARHGAQSQSRGLLLQGAAIASTLALGGKEYGQMAMGAAQLGLGMISQTYSRSAESESDLYGMRYMQKAGYDPAAAIDLQQTFVRLSGGRGQTDWLSGLFASHPPSQERVAANRETAKALAAERAAQGNNAPLRLGKDEYQRQMAYLKKIRPAYDAYTKGVKALKAGDKTQALQLAQKALSIEPKEAKFHELRGDVRHSQKRYNDALTNYNRALNLDNDYFTYYLSRGLSYYEMERTNAAKADFEASLKRVETEIAHFYLGNIAEKNGDKQAAMRHYQAAGKSNSAMGKQAASSFARLDFPQNPGRYLRTGVQVTRDGRLIAVVQNGTGNAVNNVDLIINDGRNNWTSQIRGTIPAGRTINHRTGLGPYTAEQLRQIRINVTRASIAK